MMGSHEVNFGSKSLEENILEMIKVDVMAGIVLTRHFSLQELKIDKHLSEMEVQ